MNLFEVLLDTRMVIIVEAPDAVAAQEHVKSLVPATKHQVQFRIRVTPAHSEAELTQHPGYADREITRNEPVIDVSTEFQRGAVQEGNNLDESRTLFGDTLKMNNLSKWVANLRTAGRGYVSFLNNKLKLKKPMEYDPSLLTDTKLKRPMSREGAGAEVAALNSLLSMMNDPNLTGAKVPAGEDTTARLPMPVPVGENLDKHGSTLIGRDPVMEAGPHPVRTGRPSVPANVPPPTPAPQPLRQPVGNKIFLTGRIKMGKDYVAAASEAVIFNLADPLYALAEYCFGVTVNANAGKEEFGVRDFLQTVGQWGRGEVNVKYPLTPGRAVFIKFARGLANDDRMRDAGVDWSSYGVNQNIWLEACVAKVNRYLTDNPGKRVIISGVRFVNEFKFLRAEGANHYHVMASPATWLKRLAAAKVSENSPALKDMSEGLAASLDADVTRKISQTRNGPKLHVIWNDTDVAAPSQRLLTLNEFLRELAIADVPLVEGANITED